MFEPVATEPLLWSIGCRLAFTRLCLQLSSTSARGARSKTAAQRRVQLPRVRRCSSATPARPV